MAASIDANKDGDLRGFEIGRYRERLAGDEEGHRESDSGERAGAGHLQS